MRREQVGGKLGVFSVEKCRFNWDWWNENGNILHQQLRGQFNRVLIAVLCISVNISTKKP